MASMSDITYNEILKREKLGDDDQGSYDDSEDHDEWGESSDEELGGMSGAKPLRKPRRNDTYEQ